MSLLDKTLIALLFSLFLIGMGLVSWHRQVDHAEYRECLSLGGNWGDGSCSQDSKLKLDDFNNCLKAGGVWLDHRGCSTRTPEDDCILQGGSWDKYKTPSCKPLSLDEITTCINAGGRYDARFKECWKPQ